MADQDVSWRAQDDLIGKTLGGCQVIELLGEGGMARVYRAHQANLDRDVAIKVLPPYYAADENFIKRFRQEARSLAQLSHPNIVVIHNAGQEHGLIFIIMEYISGGNLRDYISPQMKSGEVTRIIREVASALNYAHERGIVHRDVKPVNVLMDKSRRAVLSDFGIAKVLASISAMTRSGAGVGTPEYMSPEQCRGIPIDARADIYALGVMLYEMLTGHTPFEADNYTALAHSHIYEQPPDPSRYNPRILPAVKAVMLKALAKAPEDRFQTAMDMAITLEQAMAAQQPLPAADHYPSQGPAMGDRAPQSGGQFLLCPRCQQRNYANQRFCSSCGLPFDGGRPAAVAISSHMATVQRAAPTGGIICPDCKTANGPLDKFCTRCGASLLRGVQGRKCFKCGVQNGPGVRYCTACGNSLG